ncbi:V-type ATP synthase subunit C [Halococcus agarilyticus]|uniref:V-type ATP synthase subunit C n=1 Tax=Halococcus agarilyticus TaxID=1232219 RepID=UPI000677D93F|nr:V-type ATP synthase subunit C [Halococcus agarilyticus]
MSVRSGSGESNYEYVIARVRSRRSRLFDEDDYRKLIRMGPSEIARFMEESEYEEEMNALGSRHSGVDLIENALHRNLANHFDDLLRFADGTLYDYIARYLRQFDAWNIKTVLRGLYSEADREAIEVDLIRAGEFSDERIDRLLGAGSIEEVVTLLDDTLFGEPLANAYGEYEERSLLVPLENAVDRAFYEALTDGLPNEPDRATQLYVDFLESEIDFRNVRNALRLSRSGAEMDPAEYYISGGRLFDADEISQLVTNTDELVARLRESPYGDDLDAALSELDTAESLRGFERALDAALLEYSHGLSNRHPLSVCPVFAFVLAKMREIENVRAIARGKEAGLDPETIEDELVIL